METTRRSWAGTALEERRRVRREALLTAGIQLLGAVDRSASNVRAVYDEVGARARSALIAAVEGAPANKRAGAAVRVFVELMVDDPAMGRVLLLAPLREPAIGTSGVELAPRFVTLVREQLAIEDPDKRHMVAVGLVGALTSLFMGYLEGTIAVPRETLVRHCVDLVESAGR